MNSLPAAIQEEGLEIYYEDAHPHVLSLTEVNNFGRYALMLMLFGLVLAANFFTQNISNSFPLNENSQTLASVLYQEYIFEQRTAPAQALATLLFEKPVEIISTVAYFNPVASSQGLLSITSMSAVKEQVSDQAVVLGVEDVDVLGQSSIEVQSQIGVGELEPIPQEPLPIQYLNAAGALLGSLTN